MLLSCDTDIMHEIGNNFDENEENIIILLNKNLKKYIEVVCRQSFKGFKT